MKRYLEFIKESVVEKEINIYGEEDFYKIKEGVEKIFAYCANLTYLPELPDGLKRLSCWNNKLEYLPKLPENLEKLICYDNELESLPELPVSLKVLNCRNNKLKSLPELPESLTRLDCYDNPLEYPIPHKFYVDQDKIWLEKLNIKLSSYDHQKKLINEHGVYIMKKFENHPELINDKIKEENPTYFLSVEYGF